MGYKHFSWKFDAAADSGSCRAPGAHPPTSNPIMRPRHGRFASLLIAVSARGYWARAEFNLNLNLPMALSSEKAPPAP
jgi:hypothetical protein